MEGCMVVVRRGNGGVMVLLRRKRWGSVVVVRRGNGGMCGGGEKRKWWDVW